jgi:deoxyribonuclease-4
MLYLGCHLSASAGYLAMGETALSIGANTFQFFTRNPRGGDAKPLDLDDAAKLNALLEANGFGKLIAHAPYTLNPCSAKPEVRDFAFRVFKDDLARMEAVPGNYYNFHPGSHVGQGIEAGFDQIADIVNRVLTPELHTTILLETMSGKGSEVGSSFEELRAIIDRTECSDRIGVCLDTCHVSDAGYDIVGDLDGVLAEFDRVIGLERLKALHLNDSKNPRGARKDRHACIGEGTIGRETFRRIVNHPALKHLPMCLETPTDLEGYAREIALLRSFEA